MSTEGKLKTALSALREITQVRNSYHPTSDAWLVDDCVNVAERALKKISGTDAADASTDAAN